MHSPKIGFCILALSHVLYAGLVLRMGILIVIGKKIFTLATVCLESVELEKATLTITFKDSESVEKFNESKDEFYLPRFREIYLEAKRMIERLGIEAHFLVG